MPLFPGYVFLCSSPGERLEVLALGAVVRVLPVRRPEILLEELRRIRRVVEAGAQVSPAAGFPLGRRVRVIGGALLGLEAETADRRSRRGVLRLVLRVSMLGQAALVEIDPEDVELLPVTRERCSEPGSGRRVRPAGWEGHSPAGTV